MHIYQNIKEAILNLKECVLTIGNFDGVHLGHQKMIHLVQEIAKQHDLSAAVMSFEPHPRDFFSHGESKERRLCTADEKRKRFEALGVDFYFELPFNEELASMSGAEFVEQILIDWAKAKFIVVGDNFYFGKNKSGSVALLKDYESRGYFKVCIPDYARDEDGTIISSTLIRNLLEKGETQKANRLLGYTL